MRSFEDAQGRTWVATVRERSDGDYKGRFSLFFALAYDESRGCPLTEIRWNSERTARRTLSTMSSVELRRKLHVALGRTAQRGELVSAEGHAASK